MVILMADVSSWQPESDSWFHQLADVGVKAVVVKLTEGTTYRNPKAAAQLAAGEWGCRCMVIIMRIITTVLMPWRKDGFSEPRPRL